ncbi:MAG: tyrosine-protein phosphatase [Lachnospiraceae bacterium]|nr:tyrosine-protein phosphatase [Lachnospiraceae bacterium]
MTPLRHLPLEGLENARDLGGYATNDGGVTRYGVYLRSELPENLTEKDLQILKDYHVVRSLDLRGASETVTEPSALSNVEGIEYMNIPMFDTAAAAGSESERRKRPEPPKDFKMPDWDVTYIRMLEDHKHWALQILDPLSTADGCVHFNCFTGKDRTGIASAMLFTIAGVSREDICADYTLSMAYLGRRYSAMVNRLPFFPKEEDGRPNLAGGFFATLPTYMQKMLEYLDEHYGGMIPYLKACGVTDDIMKRIKDKFVEY